MAQGYTGGTSRSDRFWNWFAGSWKIIIVVLVAIGAFALVVLAVQHVNASKPAAGAEAGLIPTFSSTRAAVTRFAVVGDSVTAANSNDIDAGDAGDGSWAYYADRDGLNLVGGWAQPGATTAVMNDHVQKYDADVLVVLAGTNDTGQNVPFDTTAANLRSIVQKAGISTVVISSIPPRDANPNVPTTYNAKLEALAKDEGWKYVDGAAALRDGDHYKSGYTADGIHPTPKGAEALGAALRIAIAAAN